MEYLKKEVKDHEARKKPLNKKRKAVMTLLCSRPTPCLPKWIKQVIADGVTFEKTKLVCKETASMVISLRKPLLDNIQSRKDSMAKIERQIEQLLGKSDTEDEQFDGAKQPAEATAVTASQKKSSRKRKSTPKAQAVTQQQKKSQAAASQRWIEHSQSKPSALATARDKL
jgi:hypothetical protein